ncbi:MAG: response regulator [Methanosarcinaceae archaeon]|nr:response regulator [Methanosarcinaceae archaeon]
MTKILVVEDNPMNMELVVDLLESYGYDSTKAENGEVALEMVKEKAFDLVLLDMQLPKMDGTDVLRIIKDDQQTKDIPVIALTAHSMRGDEEKFLNAGCAGYMSKPIDIHKFKEIIDGYLKQ